MMLHAPAMTHKPPSKVCVATEVGTITMTDKVDFCMRFIEDK